MPMTPYNALSLGIMYTEIGDFDNAIKWFSYDQKHGWYPWIRVFVKNKKLLQDPRFLKLIKDMNLPDPSPLVYNPI